MISFITTSHELDWGKNFVSSLEVCYCKRLTNPTFLGAAVHPKRFSGQIQSSNFEPSGQLLVELYRQLLLKDVKGSFLQAFTPRKSAQGFTPFFEKGVF